MTEHHIRPREEWLDPNGPPWEGFPAKDGTPYKCPPFRGWPAITDIVIHYPGADWADVDFDNDGDVDLDDDITQIRLQHKMYATSATRKYSLGYCFLIGQTGGIWESRGLRNANAANLGQASMGKAGWNAYSVSVQLIVDIVNGAGAPATAAQIDSVNWLLDEFVRLKGGPLRLYWHGQGQATACAGAGVIEQSRTGVIGFGKSAAVVIDPPAVPVSGTYPPGSRDVMYPIDYGIAGTDSWWTEMAITPKGLQWSGGPSPESQEIRKIFVAVPLPRAPRLQNDADVINLMETIGTFGDCPSTFLQNPGLSQAWAANLNPGR